MDTFETTVKYPDTLQTPKSILNLAELYKQLTAAKKTLSTLTQTSNTADLDTKQNALQNPFAADAQANTQPKDTPAQHALEGYIANLESTINTIDTELKQTGKEQWSTLVQNMRKYHDLASLLPENLPSMASLEIGMTQVDVSITTMYKENQDLYEKAQKTQQGATPEDDETRQLRQLFTRREVLQEKIGAIEAVDAEAKALNKTDGVTKSIISNAKEEKYKNIKEEMQTLRDNDFNLELALRISTLRSGARDLLNGRIPNVPSIQQTTDDIVFYIRELGAPVLLDGGTGTGKTSLLKQIARDKLSEKAVQRFVKESTIDPNSQEWGQALRSVREPYMISGYSRIDVSEILGHMSLVVGHFHDFDERETAITEIVNKWNKANPDAEDAEKAEIKKHAAEFTSKGETATEFTIGPLYRAMQDGKPLIIDEINAIPHSMLIVINELMTHKAGSEVQMQGNGGKTITVQDGFCVLASGNFGSEYDDLRHIMDIAILNRFMRLKHGYLPQFYPRMQETYILADNNPTFERLELLTELLMFHMVDGKTFADTLDQDTKKYILLDTLGKFAMSARELQDITEGKHDSIDYDIQAPSMRDIKFIMRMLHANPKQRPSQNIALEQAIYDIYITQIQDPVHKFFVMDSVFKKKYGLFADWEINGDAEVKGLISATPPSNEDQVPDKLAPIPDEVLATTCAGELPKYKAPVELVSATDEPLSIAEKAEIHANIENAKNKIDEITKYLENDSLPDELREKLEAHITELENVVNSTSS